MVGMRKEVFSPIFQADWPSLGRTHKYQAWNLNLPALQGVDPSPWQSRLGCG